MSSLQSIQRQETNYKQRKILTRGKEEKTNQSLKIKISLTRWHQKVFEYTPKVTDDYSLLRFVCTDINGNLKMRLKDSIKTEWSLASITKRN